MDMGKNIAMEIITINEKYFVELCFGISEYENEERKGLWYLWLQLLIDGHYIIDTSGKPNFMVLDDVVEESAAVDKFIRTMLVDTESEAQRYHNTIRKFESLCYCHNQTVYELKQKMESK